MNGDSIDFTKIGTSRFRQMKELGSASTKERKTTFFQQLRSSLTHFRKWFVRATEEQSYERLINTYEMMERDMLNPPTFHWPNKGRFKKELKVPDVHMAGESDDEDLDAKLSDIVCQRSVPLTGGPPNALRRQGTAAGVPDIRWHTDEKLVQPGDYLIVRADESPGFWLCQVTKVIRKQPDGTRLPIPKLGIVWWSTKNKTGFGVYHEWTQLGVPQTGEIDMDMIMFVFDKLTSGRKRIPRQIQKELRQHYAEQLETFAANNKTQGQSSDSAVDGIDDHDEDMGADL